MQIGYLFECGNMFIRNAVKATRSSNLQQSKQNPARAERTPSFTARICRSMVWTCMPGPARWVVIPAPAKSFVMATILFHYCYISGHRCRDKCVRRGEASVGLPWIPGTRRDDWSVLYM